MKRVSDLTLDVGSSTSVNQQARTLTLNPPTGYKTLGAVLILGGTAQSAPALKVSDGTRTLGEVYGFAQPLASALTGPQQLTATISWAGWASNMDLRVIYYTGLDPAKTLTLQEGASLGVKLDQAASFTLSGTQTATITVAGTGQADIYRNGALLGTVGGTAPTSLSVSGVGLYTALPKGMDVTLTRAAGSTPPTNGTGGTTTPPTSGTGGTTSPPTSGTGGTTTPPTSGTGGTTTTPPPPPPPPLQSFPQAGADAVALLASAAQRFALTVGADAYLEVKLDASAPVSALLTGPGGKSASLSAAPGLRTLAIPQTSAGEHVLELRSAEDAEVLVRVMVAALSPPGEYRRSSQDDDFGWVLRVRDRAVLSMRLTRAAGAEDRPRLTIGPRTGPPLAQSGYEAELRAHVPPGDYLLRADDQGTPYTDVTVFIQEEADASTQTA